MEILEILKGLHPEIDFESMYNLIDDKIIDSFDIVTLVSKLVRNLILIFR